MPDPVNPIRPIGPVKPIVVPNPNNLVAPSPFKIIDYQFAGLQLSNPDRSMPVNIGSGKVVTGPGDTALGKLDKAVEFGPSGKAVVSLANSNLDSQIFAIRTCFQALEPVSGRQNLVESDRLPFSLFLDRTNGGDQFKIVGTIGTKQYGWTGLDTSLTMSLKLNKFYVADLIFHIDTLTILIDGEIAGSRYFPNAELMPLSGHQLYIGSWVDGVRNHFSGTVAGVQLFHKAPPELLAKLDESRQQPEWFISHKKSGLDPNLLGNPISKPTYTYNAWRQNFQSGQMQYAEPLGTAFEMHGSIWNYYSQLSEAEQKEFDFLVSDEMDTASGRGRKSLFRGGGIYWSPDTGSVPVTNQLYLDFEALGETSYLGFPKASAGKIAKGLEQEFENGRMYYKENAPRSFEVHGAILERYLLIGGADKIGFPVSNEMDVLDEKGAVLGRVSHFEFGNIYWSDTTGAFEMYNGNMLNKYLNLKGPLGVLGFPTSGVEGIPGEPNGFYNTFQNGSILRFGSNDSDIFVGLPFRIYLGRVDSAETEGAGMGQNDLSVDAYIEGLPTGTIHKRFPDSGDLGNHNIVDLNYLFDTVIVPNSPYLNIVFRADVWDIDPGPNDLMGNYSHGLTMANGWGMRTNNGIFDEGVGPRLKHITWSIQPVVDTSTLTQEEKWWGVKNPGGPDTSYDQYASAFSNVDSDPETIDVGDWFDKAFYGLVVKDLAKGGVCMGQCIEAIHAWKGNSLFALPLNRFSSVETVQNEFLIKHPRQVGAPAIWWFVSQLLSGNTHDPVSVFKETELAFNLGLNPVLCLAQNYDFSGHPHVILPYAWERAGVNWRIHVLDPNFPSGAGDPTRFVNINTDSNTFSYDGGSNKYNGSTWSGGRLYYMPWAVLCDRPRTPFWEAVLLLATGTIVIFGDGGATESITDATGTNLDYFHPEVTNLLQAGKIPQHRFLSFKGFFGAGGALSGQMYLRKGLDFGPKKLIKAGASDVINADFIHKISGTQPSANPFEYTVKCLRKTIKATLPLTAGENLTYTVKDIHQPSNRFGIGVTKDKLVELEFHHKLNTQKDSIHIRFEQIPVKAANELRFNVRPGWGGFDIEPSSDAVNTIIHTKTTINGAVQEKRFHVRIEGGMRIRLSSLLSQSELIVSKVDHLFASPIDLMTVRAS